MNRANKEDANNRQLIDNYERQINQLKLDEFDQRLSKSTNKFWGDYDTQPIDAIKLDSSTKIPSFEVPLINSKQPKFLGIDDITEVGVITLGAWLVEALSEAYQTVKFAALAGIIQAGIVWIVETIFTSGIDLFKELLSKNSLMMQWYMMIKLQVVGSLEKFIMNYHVVMS